MLVEPWATYVKGWAFFVSQGGLKQRWGKHWRKTLGRNYEDAKRRAERRRADTTGAKA